MKGQYKIILETIFILLGILISSYVISNFQSVQAAASNITAEDNFNTVANQVLIGVIKASMNPGYMARIDIPETIAGHTYKVRLEGNILRVISLKNPDVAVTREIFNIDKVDRIASSEVLSSAQIAEVFTNEDGRVQIRRQFINPS